MRAERANQADKFNASRFGVDEISLWLGPCVPPSSMSI